MLMTAIVDGQLTTVAKHTLFRVPLLGRLLKFSGVVPVERANDVTTRTVQGNVMLSDWQVWLLDLRAARTC